MGKYENSIETSQKFPFISKTYLNLEGGDFKGILVDMIKTILSKISAFQELGSGWYFKRVVEFIIYSNDYKTLKGCSYIVLPDKITARKAIINIQNKGNKCFMWSILRYLHLEGVHNTHRLTDLKQYENDLNFKGISFPVKITDISKFEKQNPNIPPINVFSINDKNEVYPLRLNDQSLEKTIDLFFHQKDDNSHYSLIKNLNRLVDLQVSKNTNVKKHFCKRCFQHYTKLELLQNHIKFFSTNRELAIPKMPKPGIEIEFKNFNNQLPMPFVIYADFESLIIPIEKKTQIQIQKKKIQILKKVLQLIIKNIYLVDFVYMLNH